ncbi:MAG: DNA mismatch repair protein MutS, partial [Lactobacillales bacterium]|nr:DNA mismatch repair protein MutS [Lactobacillales bacterium]
LDLKEQYQDAFLLFRMGDFYEFFYEDAIKAAQLLELTLTSRNKLAENPIPMAGVPYHAAQNYIEILVDQGYKVAIAEQMEDSKQTKGVVKREVVQVITPGTVLQSKEIQAKENNYLTAVIFMEKRFGFAYTDLSTGELKSTILTSEEEVFNEAAALRTKEMVLGTLIPESLQENLSKRLQLIFSEQFQADNDADVEINFLTQDLKEINEIVIVKKLLTYLRTTQKRNLGHLQKAISYRAEQFLKIDYSSKINLELIRTIRTSKKSGSLFWLLDETKTAMGGRMLKQWLDRPLINAAEIASRQDMVESLFNNFFERADLKESLKEVYDLERLSAKVSFGTINPRELLQLRNSLSQVPKIRLILEEINIGEFDALLSNITPNKELQELITKAINEDAALTLKEGGIIKEGYHKQLDNYRHALTDGSRLILKLEQKERELTGIKTLRIDYNRKDGYYFHITNSNISAVPVDRYFRKVTLKNAERYGTEELEKMQSTILEATEKSAELEYELFLEVRKLVEQHIERLQELAKAISKIDVLQSLANIAEKYQYIRPTLQECGQVVKIIDGRHPVIEKVLGAQEYIPNNITLDANTSILLITGPNMSGKSTYMRQCALIVILSQIGSFVPAKSAFLPIFDQIFTRIGASDDLIAGQSTFMVEMMEANLALNHASAQSLILFDELGRGTATYDGMALAQAIIEYIHKHIGAKTLFSTHYHELTVLEEELSGLQNIHVGAVEQNGELIFLHKILSGSADKSYGIHVAKIAGLPKELLKRAEKILMHLETNGTEIMITSQLPTQKLTEATQLSLFDKENETKINILERLKTSDVFAMTPIEAMNLLFELKQELEKQ